MRQQAQGFLIQKTGSRKNEDKGKPALPEVLETLRLTSTLGVTPVGGYPLVGVFSLMTHFLPVCVFGRLVHVKSGIITPDVDNNWKIVGNDWDEALHTKAV